MKNFLFNAGIHSATTSIGLLILRAALGVMMLMSHGVPKITKFGELAEKFPDPLGIGTKLSLLGAVGAEAGCSALLIVGLFSRFAAIPLAFTMAVAAFMIHQADGWAKQEFPLLYLIGFLAIVFTGAGNFSLDARFGKK